MEGFYSKAARKSRNIQRKKSKKRNKARGFATFDLLGLPRELRDAVYEAVVRASHEHLEGSFNRPGSRVIRRRIPLPGDTYGRQMYAERPRDLIPTRHLLRHGLLYVSKQIHAEYARVLYKNDVFPIFHISPENIVVEPSTSAADMTASRRLKAYWELSPILKSYLKRCEIQLTWNAICRKMLVEHVHNFADPVGDALEGFSRLTSVNVFIHSPRNCHFQNLSHQNLFRKVFDTCVSLSTVKHLQFRIECGYDNKWVAELHRREGGEWHVTVHNGMLDTRYLGRHFKYLLAPADGFEIRPTPWF